MQMIRFRMLPESGYQFDGSVDLRSVHIAPNASGTASEAQQQLKQFSVATDTFRKCAAIRVFPVRAVLFSRSNDQRR